MRRILPALSLILCGIILLAIAWLWWERPERAEMAAYVPQDSLVYIEANSLPDILAALTSTEAWQTLAPAAGVRADVGRLGWLARFAGWSGIGSAESVVFARAQVAVAVLGVDAREGSDLALEISPRVVIVAETHASESRARAAVTKFVGEFARKAYGEPKFEEADRGGVRFAFWTAPAGGKKIVAAFAGSAAFVGNDESAVLACLAAQRGERAALSGDPELGGMRQRVGAEEALAFGYAPQGSAPKLTQIAALVLASRSSSDARAQSALAIVLPQLAGRLLGGAAWSAKVNNRAVEDSYYFALSSDLTSRLAVALEASPDASFHSAEYLPADAHQITRYNFSEPDETWRGVNAIVSSELDPTFAPFAGAYLGKSLEPFGVDAPRDFLRAAGPEIATARLDAEGDELAFVAAVRDEKTLRSLLDKRLGGGTLTEHVGNAEMRVSRDAERGAASLFENHVILGSEAAVRRCLEARASGNNLASSDAFKKPLGFAPLSGAQPPIVSMTDDREQARRFVSLAAPRRSATPNAPDAATLARAVAALPFSVSVTRLATDGLERKTLSPFGQFAAIALQLSPDAGAPR
ncbi:MAG TPA: hypothetical protein VM864_04815 [Pyrinomonadaceae bacterium]|nr:hypothetical protein [Pyrinomonadaceae bacterium]